MPKASPKPLSLQVPEGHYTVPLGKAAITGRHGPDRVAKALAKVMEL